MSVYISVELRQQIRNQFANCCAYCRTAEALTGSTFEFEHILPLSAGGQSVLENLCFSCPSCNRSKATRRIVPDPDTLTRVSLFHPQQQRWTEHFLWNNDATKLVGLTTVGRATIAALKMNRSALIHVRKLWVKLGEHPPVIDPS